MIRITSEDFIKLVKMIEKEGQGGILAFKEDGATLKVLCHDKSGKEMTLELSDVQYPMKPRITKTETF